jgi:hypothetical protein
MDPGIGRIQVKGIKGDAFYDESMVIHEPIPPYERRCCREYLEVVLELRLGVELGDIGQHPSLHY